MKTIFNTKKRSIYLSIFTISFLTGCAPEIPKESNISQNGSPGFNQFDPNSLDSVSAIESYGVGSGIVFQSSNAIWASVETYLKYNEAAGGRIGKLTFDDQIESLSGNIFQSLNGKIMEIIRVNVENPTNYSAAEIIDRMLDKGIVVKADIYTNNCTSSQLNTLVQEDGSAMLTYANQIFSLPLSVDATGPEELDRILDKGMVLELNIDGPGECKVQYAIVGASVETYLKYAEALGLTSYYKYAVPASYTPNALDSLLAMIERFTKIKLG